MSAAVIPPGADRFGTCVLLRLPPMRRAVSFYFDTSQFPFLFFIFTLFGKKLSVRTAFFFSSIETTVSIEPYAKKFRQSKLFGSQSIKTEIHAPGFYEFCSLLQNSINFRWCAKGKTDGRGRPFFLFSLCLCEKLPRLAHILVNRSAQRFRGVETHFRPQELVQLDVDHLAV